MPFTALHQNRIYMSSHFKKQIGRCEQQIDKQYEFVKDMKLQIKKRSLLRITD